jgi:hypothetical protein
MFLLIGKMQQDRDRIIQTHVTCLRQVGGFLWVLKVSSTNKTDHHDIAEILLKLALNTIRSNQPSHLEKYCKSKQ